MYEDYMYYFVVFFFGFFMWDFGKFFVFDVSFYIC